MRNLGLILILILGLTGTAHAVPVTLAQANCDSALSLFAPGLTSTSSFFYAGSGSCRGNGGTYTRSLLTPITVASKVFDLTYYSRQNITHVVTVGFSNGTTATLNRIQVSSVLGGDGTTWFLMKHRFVGAANDARSINSVSIFFPNTEWIDSTSFTVDDNILITSYMKFQTGFSDVSAFYNLDDVLAATPELVVFKLAGRIPSGNYVDIEVLDEGQFTYLDCSSVAFSAIRYQLTDNLGASYSLSCISGSLITGKRGLFRITNTGSSPTLEVQFDINFLGLPKINPDATSSNFSFNLDVQMTLYP